ncbi:aminotransferase class I/II-fold pyridoxal phosphate-dependent enzyme [bacterium]|nr:aminotransferase class I/II-fold pyridoxal phosphate-dependent enzyme [bacterium]
MQALILAAGMGRRLGPHTKDNTKCMLKVHDTTLIERTLDNLDSVGVTKLILVVGYKRENLQNFLGNRYKNVDIEYVVNPIYATTNNIYSLYLAKDSLLEDDTILLESDLIFDKSILEMLLNDKNSNLAVVDKYKSWMDGTVVKIDGDNNIENFIPRKFFDFREVDRYYKTVNIYKFSKEFSRNIYVPFLEAYSSALGNNEYYEQVLRVILTLESVDLKALPLSGERWYEIDDVQDLDNAETIFATTPDTKLKKMQLRYGGYWRYPELKDFCYLVNPYFPTKKMESEFQAYFHNLITEYPSGLNVQNLLAGKLFDIDQQNIVVGNGAAELIRIIPRVIDGSFGIMTPTFNEYVNVIESERVIMMQSGENFSYGRDEILTLAQKCDTVILINPDNPSGNFIKKSDVISLAQDLKTMGKRLILDESFVDFSTEGVANSLIEQDILDEYDNLIIMKSISKSYGVPGVRLGVLASSDSALIEKFAKAVSIWNINSFGEFFLQIIGKYLKEYRSACIQIAEERDRFFRELQTISFLEPIPSQANYFTCKVVDRFSAPELAQILLEKESLFIKDLTGKPGISGNAYIRIAVRDFDDNELLIQKLREV